jgi:hypothetical protein
MEAFSLAFGIILMLVAAIGIVFYVALVIAIPVCRMLDWVFDTEEKDLVARPSRFGTWARSVTRRTAVVAQSVAAFFARWIGRH